MDGASITIIGAGPLGIGLAYRMEQAGCAVAFLQRQAPRPVSGKLRTPQGDKRFRYEPPSAAHLRDTRIVFVAVKAFDLAAALHQHLPLFPTPIPVVSLCNGAIDGVLRQAASDFPHLKFRLGISTTGVKVVAENTYEISDGRFEWGPLLPEQNVSPIESYLFERAPEIFLWHGEPLPAMRKKWLFNVVINSLAGSHRLTSNGELLTNLSRVDLAFREALALGEKEWGPWNESRDELYGQLINLIERTAQNENSMARDIRLGRRTESEFLAGLALPHPEFPVLRKLHAQLMLP